MKQNETRTKSNNCSSLYNWTYRTISLSCNHSSCDIHILPLDFCVYCWYNVLHMVCTLHTFWGRHLMNKSIIFGTTVVVLSLLTVFYMIKPNQPAEVLEPKSNFEVVDNYRGCDLLRWTNSQLAEYKYVLYCPK